MDGRWTPESDVLLDPTFWQALAIARGWDVKEGTLRCEHYNPNYDKPGERGCNADKCEYAGYRNYRTLMVNFMEQLADGKDAESFFAELLT